MFRKQIFLFCIIFIVSLFFFQITKAGFGISPPYVSNDNLTTGSVYEKKIVIVRGDPNEDLKAEITFNVPGANDWISIDKGTEFILPKGEKQVPITVSVKVPKDAKYGDYKGSIRIKTSPVEALEKGVVSIALGAQIDVDLKVTKAKIFDFIVRGVSPLDAETGYTKWFLHFPTKLTFQLRIENLGNIFCRPTKIVLDIYDSNKTNLVETVEAKKIGGVKPFENGTIFATFLSKLEAGSYYVQYKVYKNGTIAQGGQGEVHLSVVPHNTIKNYKGPTIFDLSIKEQIIIFSIAFVILLGLGFGAFKLFKTFKRK